MPARTLFYERDFCRQLGAHRLARNWCACRSLHHSAFPHPPYNPIELRLLLLCLTALFRSTDQAAAAPADPVDQARWAARFILNLWNPTQGWRAGWFDVHQALSDWDDAHRPPLTGVSATRVHGFGQFNRQNLVFLPGTFV